MPRLKDNFVTALSSEIRTKHFFSNLLASSSPVFDADRAGSRLDLLHPPVYQAYFLGIAAVLDAHRRVKGHQTVPSGPREVTTGNPAAVALARAVGRVSRAWNQRGLGTMYLYLGRIPGLRDADCCVEFRPGCWFNTQVFEPYWAPVVLGQRPYEAELLQVLALVSDLDPVFVDCGANLGYWSIIASSEDFGLRRVVAIEPNPTTFQRLTKNAQSNQGRFECLEYAVSSSSGESVWLHHAEHHAVATIAASGSGAASPNAGAVAVQTTSIGDALTQLEWRACPYVLVKLDVEGHELAALDGVGDLDGADQAFVFEELTATGYATVAGFLDRGFRLFAMSKDGQPRPVPSVAAARRVATEDKRAGKPYNFVAVKGDGEMARRFYGATNAGE